MSSASRWSWLAASMLLAVMLAAGVLVSGCSPGPDGKQDGSTVEEDTTEPEDTTEAKDTTELKDTTEPKDTIALLQVDLPADAEVSAYAPADDLTAQVAYYIERLEEAVESEEEYEDVRDKIAKDANTLVVIALGLGLHDQNGKHKASAGTLMKAAQDLAATADYASAKASVKAVKAAAASQEPAEGELKWEKVASLEELMKQVPLLNTKLKGCVRRLERKAADGQGHSAVIAVIAQGTMANAGDTEKPDQVEQWQQFSLQMRNAAAAVNAGIRALDQDATEAAMTQLQQSCDDCHAVFHEEDQ